MNREDSFRSAVGCPGERLSADFVRIKLQFMERLLDFVNHRIKHIKNWYLMPADQGITSKEARSLAKGQQLIFPFPGD
jgi:hypothetical protein